MKVEQNVVRFEAKDYFSLLKQRWAMFLAGVVGTAICVVALFTMVPLSFSGVAVVKVSPGEVQQTPPQQVSTAPRAASLNFMNTEAATILSRSNLEAVVQTLKLEEKWGTDTRTKAREILRSKVKAVPRSQSNLIDITVKMKDGKEAAEIANTLASQFISRRKAEIKSQAAALVAAVETDLARQQDRVTALKDEVDMLRLEKSEDADKIEKLDRNYQTQKNLLSSMEARFQGANYASIAEGSLGAASLAEPAETPLRADAPGLAFLSAVVTLLSMAGGVVIALLPVCLSRGGEVIGRLEKQLSLDLVTFVNRGKILMLEDEASSRDDAEAYRALRTRLQKMPLGPSRMVTMLACTQGEGRSEAVINAASVFADSGKSVLLIDGDLHRPSLHEVFTASPHPGLSDYLRGEMRLEETVVKTHYPNLWLMPSGPGCPDSCSLLAGKRMIDLIWEMKGRFDYIFVNSPPIFGASDAMVLTGFSDQTLLIADHRKHSVKDLKRAKRAVEMSGGKFSGLILNTPAPKLVAKQNGGISAAEIS